MPERCRRWRSASPWSARSSTRSATKRRRRNFCRGFSPARTGGARAIRSRARAPTSHRSAPRRCATATITSSTATRPGRRWPSMPTGFFAWSEPTAAAKPQSGISFLLIDMKSPGVTVRPIITIDGSHEVNDVFLEDVRVPVENLIGEENKGWTYAKFLLGNERTSMAGIGRSTRYLNRLKQIVKDRDRRRRSVVRTSSSRTSPASSSTCLRWRRPSCASSRRCRAASIRGRRPRCSRSGAPRFSSASPI